MKEYILWWKKFKQKKLKIPQFFLSLQKDENEFAISFFSISAALILC